MKIKVIKDSIIYRGLIRKVGYEFDCADNVAESLIERGYAQKVSEGGEVAEEVAEEIHEEIETEDEGEKVYKGHLDPKQLEEFSYQELKKLASDLGVSAQGTKKELIARIAEVEVECPADAEEEDGPNTAMPEM